MTGRLDRREVTAELLADRGGLLVVAGLGAPAWDVTAVGDHDLNFPLWGAMGGAAMVGLGLALTQPDRRVLVLTGDGEQLMGLTALSTIGAAAPGNLAIAVLDNERYGETGMQPTATGSGTDLAAVATACGFRAATTARDPDDVAAAVEAVREQPGPVMAVFKISGDVPPQVVPPRDGAHLVERFRSALSTG
jgi:thiamine pyrophosphate-dependent acetolactate synthase large subunit-like protein